MLAAGLALGLVTAPATAHAAKLRVGAEPLAVGADGRASVVLANPNRTAVRGRLTLRASGSAVGTARFRLPAGRSRNVRISLTVAGMDALEARGVLAVRAIAAAKNAATTRTSLTLRLAAAPAATRDGRYQGSYADNSVDVSFNVVGARLFTGPFDAFYLQATCRNADPAYTGPDQLYTDATAIEPIVATIADDGAVSGEGVHRTGSTPPIPWRITGRVTGESVSGELAADYTDVYGNPCSAVSRFSAGWYGAYTA